VEEPATYKRFARKKLTPERLKQWQTWLHFDSCQDAELAKMLRAAATFNRDICRDFWGPAYWLTFLGSSGTGKTHLAKGAWKAWERKAQFRKARGGIEVPMDGYYWNWDRFINELRERHYGVFQDACRAKFLILDDIGAGHTSSSFAIDKLYELLNARLDKWTVITANQKLETIAEWDQRIASRLIRNGNQCIEAVTKDYATRTRE
jgi:DNA replication protein DnaC